MRDVYIIGFGQTPVGEHWDRSLRDLGADAVLAALARAGIDRPEALYVGNMLSGQVANQENRPGQGWRILVQWRDILVLMQAETSQTPTLSRLPEKPIGFRSRME